MIYLEYILNRGNKNFDRSLMTNFIYYKKLKLQLVIKSR